MDKSVSEQSEQHLKDVRDDWDINAILLTLHDVPPFKLVSK